MKILGGEAVTKVFIVTCLLRNLHTGYYGSQTSRYFNLDIPGNFNLCYVNQIPL